MGIALSAQAGVNRKPGDAIEIAQNSINGGQLLQ